MWCGNEKICCCKHLVVHEEKESQGPGRLYPNGYSERNQHYHICEKRQRSVRQKKSFFGIFPLIERDGQFFCGPVQCGIRCEEKYLYREVKSRTKEDAIVPWSFGELPTNLIGPNAGKFMVYKRVFPTTNTRRTVGYWSPQTRWMHSAATMLHLMSNIDESSGDNFLLWSKRVQYTAISLWCLADYVIEDFVFGESETFLKMKDYALDGLKYFELGYGVTGASWNEFANVCGENLCHPTYHVESSFLFEKTEN
jgi:hypothetical protein